MKWQSVKKHKIPTDVMCFVITESNYIYLAKNECRDSSDYNWFTGDDCPECGKIFHHKVHHVTHFCIPDSVEIDE